MSLNQIKSNQIGQVVPEKNAYKLDAAILKI
jgi:hypothetical protein